MKHYLFSLSVVLCSCTMPAAPVEEKEHVTIEYISMTDTSYIDDDFTGTPPVYADTVVDLTGYYKTEEGENVAFTRDGKVVGLRFVTHYKTDPSVIKSNVPLNVLELRKDTTTSKYSFGYKGDTLLIHFIDYMDDVAQTGFLAYMLIKQPS